MTAPRGVKRKFGGTYGSILSALKPDRFPASAVYKDVWDRVSAHAQEVKIEHGSPSYSQAKHTLYFKDEHLRQLFDHVRGTRKLIPKEFGLLASLLHEVSHADDHLRGREIEVASLATAEEHVKGVLATEFRAWGREALVAFQMWESNGRDGPLTKLELIAGWQHYATAMLDKPVAHTGTNELMRRLCDYVGRELKKSQGFTEKPEVEKWRENADATVAKWISDHRAWIDGELQRLLGFLVPQLFKRL